MRIVRNLTGFLTGMLFAAMLFLSAMPRLAHGQDASIPPQISIGVLQCGEVIAIWVLTKEGRMFRVDAEHHPEKSEDYNALLQWLGTGKQDIYEISCSDKTSGGKQHRDEKS